MVSSISGIYAFGFDSRPGVFQGRELLIACKFTQPRDAGDGCASPVAGATVMKSPFGILRRSAAGRFIERIAVPASGAMVEGRMKMQQ